MSLAVYNVILFQATHTYVCMFIYENTNVLRSPDFV